MNTYLVPISEVYGYNFDYFIPIFADTNEEAYKNANILYDDRITDNPPYESYNFQLMIEQKLYLLSQKNVILNLAFKRTKGFEHMAYFKVNWNKYTEQLSQIADKENWSNNTYPNNGILANYIVKTYDKLTSEKKIIIGQDYALFNTGLFNKYYDPIYAYQTGTEISFLTGYELSNIGITDRPERANYFENPELLLFDWHYQIDVYYKHILDDEKNKNRLPQEFLNSDNKINIINGALETMKKRVSANYKLAIPQYYEGKIQLLLPLCLMSDNKPDVAIAVTKKNGCYQGHTCLTLDMAYNNARLIAKPETNWLSTDKIIIE